MEIEFYSLQSTITNKSVGTVLKHTTALIELFKNDKSKFDEMNAKIYELFSTNTKGESKIVKKEFHKMEAFVKNLPFLYTHEWKLEALSGFVDKIYLENNSLMAKILVHKESKYYKHIKEKGKKKLAQFSVGITSDNVKVVNGQFQFESKSKRIAEVSFTDNPHFPTSNTDYIETHSNSNNNNNDNNDVIIEEYKDSDDTVLMVQSFSRIRKFK